MNNKIKAVFERLSFSGQPVIVRDVWFERQDDVVYNAKDSYPGWALILDIHSKDLSLIEREIISAFMNESPIFQQYVNHQYAVEFYESAAPYEFGGRLSICEAQSLDLAA